MSALKPPRRKKMNRASTGHNKKKPMSGGLAKLSKKQLRKLHVGIACNLFGDDHPKPEEVDSTIMAKNISETLRDRGYRVTFFDFNDLQKVWNDLRGSDADIMFNVCEEILGTDKLEPHAAAILDLLEIPHTGANLTTLCLCMDKIKVKKLLNFHGIPTPLWDAATSMDHSISENLRYPLIVKPANTHGSVGITNDSVVVNPKQLKKQLERMIVHLRRPALVEEYIEGDEYDVSLIGNDESDLRVLPMTRNIYGDMPKGYWHIFPFVGKWAVMTNAYDKVVTQTPPKNIGEKLISRIAEVSRDAYMALDSHDYGRVEVRVDREGNPYVVDVNPNTAIGARDDIVKAAKIAGMDYGDLLEKIISMAVSRNARKL